MATKVITPAANEPISTAEAKEYLRVTHTDDDTLIGRLITAAREYVENQSKLTLQTTVFADYLQDFPDEYILEKAPYIADSVTITYTNTSAGTSTLAAAEYQIDQSNPPTISFDGTMPTTIDDDVVDNVKIQYSAGYGVAGSTVPEALRTAVMLMVAHFYDMRSPVVPVAMHEVPIGVRNIMDSFGRRLIK
ncbi:MAG TPA: hypothetical protein DF712_20790 [Balneola sp.]|nr:hypothetical protein [Balneola sp.]